ncbi:MAG: lipopolysaccharide biosynthesis protein [Candidatus Acidiferrum sp.]
MAHAVAWNAAARWASQIISWASTIVVARLLTPYDYGILGMAAFYTDLATLISQAGISNAIITLHDLTRRQVAELNTVAVLLGTLLLAVSCVLARPIAHFFSAPPLAAVIVASSTTFLINSLVVVPRALLQRELRFKLLAGIETARAFSQIVITLALAWLRFRYWSLVLGTIASAVISSLLSAYFRRHEFAVPNFSQLRRELKFSWQVMVSGIAWYTCTNADYGVGGRVLGGPPLGNYVVARTISYAPVEKVANLVMGVTPAFFSAMQHNAAELRRYVLRLTEMLSLVTVPASIGLALSADYLVPVLLGPKWQGVIGPLRLLGIFVAFRSVATILPNLLTAIGDAGFVMWSTIGSAIVMPIAFLMGSHWGTNGLAAAWVIAYPCVMFPVYRRVFQKIDMGLKEYISAVLPASSASAMMTIVLVVVRSTIVTRQHSLGTLLLIVGAGALSYSAALLTFHRQRIFRLLKALRNLQGNTPEVSGGPLA